MSQLHVLALIPSRGGSKRIPGKNLRVLGEKPLIAWSIDVAMDIPEVCATLVSTDAPEIAQVAKEAGALVPWLRPAELATDTARSIDVALHALDWYEREYESVDGLLLLQPTSPFRSRETVVRGIELFRRNGLRPVLGVSRAASHPLLAYRLNNGRLLPFIDRADVSLRSQDLPPAYVVNGAFYLATPQQLRSCERFTTEQTVPLMMDSDEESLDIDTPFDFMVAECIARGRSERPVR